jgi:hypothetical protein
MPCKRMPGANCARFRVLLALLCATDRGAAGGMLLRLLSALALSEVDPQRIFRIGTLMARGVFSHTDQWLGPKTKETDEGLN